MTDRDERAVRRAEQLRANLRRRKTQAREQAAADTPPPDDRKPADG